MCFVGVCPLPLSVSLLCILTTDPCDRNRSSLTWGRGGEGGWDGTFPPLLFVSFYVGYLGGKSHSGIFPLLYVSFYVFWFLLLLLLLARLDVLFAEG